SNVNDGIAGTAKRGQIGYAIHRRAEQAKVDRARSIDELIIEQRHDERLWSIVVRIPQQTIGHSSVIDSGASGAITGRVINSQRSLAATGSFHGDNSGTGILKIRVGAGGEVQPSVRRIIIQNRNRGIGQARMAAASDVVDADIEILIIFR